jgi:hypothetical protein
MDQSWPQRGGEVHPRLPNHNRDRLSVAIVTSTIPESDSVRHEPSVEGFGEATAPLGMIQRIEPYEMGSPTMTLYEVLLLILPDFPIDSLIKTMFPFCLFRSVHTFH